MKNFRIASSRTLKNGIAGLLISGLLMVPNTGSAASKFPFSDIGANVNKSAILKLNYAGVLKGYSDGTFRPEKQVTRAEFAKVAVLAMGYTDDQVKLYKGKTNFSDLSANDWASGYVNLAVSKGIMRGYKDGTFKPNNPVVVAEVLTVFVQGLKITVESSSSGQWYQPYLLEANKAGIYDTKESPTAPATRDVIAKFADKFMETPIYNSGSYYDKDGNRSGTFKRLAVDKGAVASYDKTAQKLKVVGQKTEISLTDDAQVYGSLVVGANVEYILENGKISFLNVLTEDASVIEGIVKTGLNFTTAVGDEKQFKAMVNGKEQVLEVEGNVSVSKANIGQKFVAVVGENGKITSITFTANQTKGLVEKLSVTSGSKAKQEIEVNNTIYELEKDATITGKMHPKAKKTASNFSDIVKGDLVELTLNVNGKVSAVEFTKLSVTEKIKVDSDDNTVSFSGYEYDVKQDTELSVDGKKVSELGKLHSDDIAILTFDKEGNLVKVDQGTIASANKLISDTTAYSSGKPATIKVDGKTFDILPNAKLKLDGVSTAATSIANDQLNDYRITSWKYQVGSNTITEMEAEKQTVKGYVTDKSKKAVTVNGKRYELLSGVSIDDDAETNDKEYTLTLNSEGKVKAVTGAPKTVSGVVDDVTIRNENGNVSSVKITVNGEKYTATNAKAVTGVDEFEYATLTLDREGKVIASSVQGKKAYENQKFKGIETRVNGEQYLFYNDLSTSLKLAKNYKVKYYDGSEMASDKIKDTDEITIWTNQDNQVYLIVVSKR